MNRRGLFAGLAGALAAPVVALLPKAKAQAIPVTVNVDVSPYEGLIAGFKASMDRYDNLTKATMLASFYRGATIPGELGPELLVPPAS